MQEKPPQPCFAKTDLRRILQRSPGDVLVIDVRTPKEYNDMHIPVAVNIPLGELAGHSNELPKNKLIITTCGKGGGRSAEAATVLQQLGFTSSSYLCGGTFGWFEF